MYFLVGFGAPLLIRPPVVLLATDDGALIALDLDDGPTLIEW